MPIIKLREREWEVEVTLDGGYESDTNCHVIEWKFIGDDPGELTDHEEQLVYDQLYEYQRDRASDFDENVI
jgi:hypothetical protein